MVAGKTKSKKTTTKNTNQKKPNIFKEEAGGKYLPKSSFSPAERDRQTETKRYRQADRQADRQTQRQTGREKDRDTETETDREGEGAEGGFKHITCQSYRVIYQVTWTSWTWWPLLNREVHPGLATSRWSLHDDHAVYSFSRLIWTTSCLTWQRANDRVVN